MRIIPGFLFICLIFVVVGCRSSEINSENSVLLVIGKTQNDSIPEVRRYEFTPDLKIKRTGSEITIENSQQRDKYNVSDLQAISISPIDTQEEYAIMSCETRNNVKGESRFNKIDETQENDSQEVLQIFNGKEYLPIAWEEIEEIEFQPDKGRMTVATNSNDNLSLKLKNRFFAFSGKSIPVIEINTEENLKEIPDKKNYKKADISISAFGKYENVTASVQIKGRGNSSWMFDKKPYRLKFKKKISLCGLKPSKNYILLANYTDPVLSQFAVATKISRMLGIPYTNEVVPVDVVFNGIYKGSYLLTNKPGINSGSVDIGKENTIMWELDENFDEDLKFKSPLLELPVMAVDPDLSEVDFMKWKEDFIEMERKAVDGEASDAVDMDIFAKYLILYDIMDNAEMGFPKSVKLYKKEGEKYKFGPIWDFDVSMGYIWKTHSNFSIFKINEPTWRNPLFVHLEKDKEARDAKIRNWKEIKTQLPEILEYIDDYATTIRSSALRDEVLWGADKEFDSDIKKMKWWLILRFEALDKIMEASSEESGSDFSNR